MDVEAWSDGKRRDGGKYRERRIEMEGDKQRSDLQKVSCTNG